MRFMLIEKDSENSIMYPVWFDRNAVVHPHVIKIKLVLHSDLAVCKPLLMCTNTRFRGGGGTQSFYFCCLCCTIKEKGSFWQIAGAENCRDHFGLGCNYQKRYRRLFCKPFHCEFWQNFILFSCMEFMGRCVRAGNTNLFLPCICSTSSLSEVIVCQQDLI